MADSLVGTRLSERYELIEELGRGGMGVVYRAHDPLLDREVAVKVMGENLSEEAVARFEREARVVARMDHPSIVGVHDFGRAGNAVYFVMPLVRGSNLRAFMAAGGLSIGDVLDVCIGIAEALDYSHAAGVVHRDIKPENTMVARDEEGRLRVRITDFGLAISDSEQRITGTGMLLGTIVYLAPEQVRHLPIDARTDIYSLGTLLYECLCGRLPFAGDLASVVYRVAHELPDSPSSLGINLHPALESLIMQCLEKDPAGRPQRAREVAEALRRVRLSLDGDDDLDSLHSTLRLKAGLQAPIIGRDAELGELQTRMRQAGDGECQLVLVSGPSGIGKTRLIDELERLARFRQLLTLRGRFVEHDRAFAYQGYCELIQAYFRIRPSSTGASAGPLVELAEELMAIFPVLAELRQFRPVSGVVTAGGPPALDNRAHVFELLARALARMADGQPLVVLLEDMHGADVSVEALQYIVRRLAATPTLIVATYDSTQVPKHHPLQQLINAFRGDRRFAQISVGPLPPDEHRALVTAAIGSDRFDETFVRKIYEATEGNPFFTKELLRSMIDSGRIRQDQSGAWTLAAEGVTADALPATIQQAVEKRIERLPESLREVLSTASVLGNSFEFRDLETLAGRDTLDDEVDELVRGEFLEEERDSRGDRLAFSSHVVREVLYTMLSRRRRKTLHRSAAEALEARHAGRLERVYTELLHHFAAADVPEKVTEYGLRLARRSLDMFSYDDAIRVVRMVLEFIDQEPAVEAEARLILGRAFRGTGHTEESLRELGRAIQLLEAEHDEAGLLAALHAATETAWDARRVDDTIQLAEKGIAVSARSGAPQDAVPFLSLRATVANLRGEYAVARQYLAEADRLQQQVSEPAQSIPRGGTIVATIPSFLPADWPVDILLSDEAEVLSNVYETLVVTDSRGSVAPGLCVSWKLEEGGRTVRLELRDGVRMHDGTPLTAATVQASIEASVLHSPMQLPAAFAAIEGVAELGAGERNSLSGVEVLSALELQLTLRDALPIFPSLLSDPRTAIIRPPEGEKPPAGSGPFVVESREAGRVVLRRNEHHWSSPPFVDVLEFQTGVKAREAAQHLSSGWADIARDLLPEDLDKLLNDRRRGTTFVEVPKKGTYFILFNASGPIAQARAIPHALSSITRKAHLVQRTLGRFARPAEGLLPPGILGHEAGRRSHDRVAGVVHEALRMLPIRLRAAVHPAYLDRYAAFTAELLALWRDSGVEASLETSDMAEYARCVEGETAGIDLVLARWNADYDDPDSFAFGLFHSRSGRMRNVYASTELDEWIEAARAESRVTRREELYRRIETHLLESGLFIPLFHEIDYRVANASVRGLRLHSSPPFVNYAEIGKSEQKDTRALRQRGGVVDVPFTGDIGSLDPTLVLFIVQAEVIPNVFETLTREAEGARIVPWLAESFQAEDRGRAFRFRLRENVRFQDGRLVTARDVRYSFERLLLSPQSQSRWLLSSVRGARELIEGTGEELTGFRVSSSHEFTIELEEPVAFFPSLLAYSPAAIVPEGSNRFSCPWYEGCVGTGPYRVTAVDAKRIELEPNPYYWRAGIPRGDNLVFHFNASPEEIVADFRAGRYSLAWELTPADVETLRNDPEYAARYRESPRLSTYYIVFNIHHGPLRDEGLRQHLKSLLDVPELVHKNVRQLGLPAVGLIPPGLLGHGGSGARGPRGAAPAGRIALRASLIISYEDAYKGVTSEIFESWRKGGIDVSTVPGRLVDLPANAIDMTFNRWIADYPDADTFVHDLLHSKRGLLGRLVGLPELDRLIEQGRVETEPSIRHEIYREIEEILARRALLIPLFHEKAYCFARPEVEGFKLSFGTPIVPYEELWIRR